MAIATGWAYYYKIRPINDHMDTLRLYREYKHYWDKHRIPGETKINEVLWEDTWWKINSPYKVPRKLPPLRRSKRLATRKGGTTSTLPQNEPSQPGRIHQRCGPKTIVSTPAVKRPSTYTAVHSSSRSLMAKSGQSQQHDVVKLPQIGSDSSKSLLSSVVVSPTSSHNTMDNHPIPEPEE